MYCYTFTDNSQFYFRAVFIFISIFIPIIFLTNFFSRIWLPFYYEVVKILFQTFECDLCSSSVILKTSFYFSLNKFFICFPYFSELFHKIWHTMKSLCESFSSNYLLTNMLNSPPPKKKKRQNIKQIFKKMKT